MTRYKITDNLLHDVVFADGVDDIEDTLYYVLGTGDGALDDIEGLVYALKHDDYTGDYEESLDITIEEVV